MLKWFSRDHNEVGRLRAWQRNGCSVVLVEKHIVEAEIAPGRLVAFGTARTESGGRLYGVRGPGGRAGNLLLVENILDQIGVPLLSQALWHRSIQHITPPALGAGSPSVLRGIFPSLGHPGEGPWGKKMRRHTSGCVFSRGCCKRTRGDGLN